MPERDEAEVAQRGQADQPQHVVLADRDERAVHDRDQRQHDHDRRGPPRGLGEQPEAEAQHPEGADLVEHADQQHAGAGVACSVVSASQVCTGNSGALTAKAMKKPTKSQRWALSRCRGAQVGEQVGRAPGLGGDDVEADHRGEHDQAAAELEHQELQGGATRGPRGRTRRPGSTPGSAWPRRRRRRGRRRSPRRRPARGPRGRAPRRRRRARRRGRRRARRPAARPGPARR